MPKTNPFTKEELEKDLEFIRQNNISVLLVEADSKKGFEYPYLIYIPNSPQSTLIMDCLNNYETPMSYDKTENSSAVQEVYSLFREMLIPSDIHSSRTNKTQESKQETLDRLYDRLGRGINTIANLQHNRFENAPILVPLIHGYTDRAGMSDLNPSIAKEFAPQIVAMIKDAKQLVYERTNTKLNDKIMAYGHSKSSEFANNFSALHPEMVECIMLAGTEEFTLPISEIYLQVVEENEKSDNEQFEIINGNVTKKVTKSEFAQIVAEYTATKKEHQKEVAFNNNGTYTLPLNFPVGIADIEHYIDLSHFPRGKAEYSKILSSIPRTIIVGEREEAETGHFAYSSGKTLNGISVKAGDDLALLDPQRKITEIERASMHNRVLEYIAASQALFGKSANERLRNYMQLCDILGIKAQSKIYKGIGHVDIYSSQAFRDDSKQYYEALVQGQYLTLGNDGRVSRISPVDQLIRRYIVDPSHDEQVAKIKSLSSYGVKYNSEKDSYTLSDDSSLFKKVQAYLSTKRIPTDSNMDRIFDELTAEELTSIFSNIDRIFTETEVTEAVLHAVSISDTQQAAKKTHSDIINRNTQKNVGDN